MTDGQFLNAVALGQVTPGPVVLTVAVVGYAAAGVGGALRAAAVAFSPSFLLVVVGADRFHALLADRNARAFIDGAAPAALGAILGSAIPLALALDEAWQLAVLAAAAVALLLLRRGVVVTLLGAGAAGAAAALAGAPLTSWSPAAALPPRAAVHRQAAQLGQLVDLGQRQAGVLRLADHAQPVQHRRPVPALTACALRRGQQPGALVVAHARERQAGAVGDLGHAQQRIVLAHASLTTL
jgi:chromate transport protein ChrA